MNSLQEVIKKRYAGAQSFLQEGCLFLSLCSIAEQESGKPVDILEALAFLKQKGYIDSKNNMRVSGQLELLERFTGKEWERASYEADKLPNPVPENMYTIEKWLNKRTGYTHFRRRFCDTLVNSTTVKEGALVCYYAYTHN